MTLEHRFRSVSETKPKDTGEDDFQRFAREQGWDEQREDQPQLESTTPKSSSAGSSRSKKKPSKKQIINKHGGL
jgi:hypothetical protein